MILVFPDLQTLELAITSAAVPPELSATAARGGEAGGRILLETEQPLSQSIRRALRDLGVRAESSANGVELAPLACWHQLLPLAPQREAALPERSVVLIEPSSPQQLVELAGEMLRLGNDRQETARLEPADDAETDEMGPADETQAAGEMEWADGSSSEQETGPGPRQPSAGRLLLRVIDPPYYTLLRVMSHAAVENRARPDGVNQGSKKDERAEENHPVAYIERRPRVWVELGYAHPLADRLEPPPGRMLLLRPPRDWTLIEEPAFRDLYPQLEFQLPAAETQWRAAELDHRIRIPLQLAHSGDDAPAELWVLHDDAERQIEQLVANADDALLSRLSFAVGKSAERRIVVLRARPSKNPPPVLVLRGAAFRAFLKLPNLFVPCGYRLHPPLRRDVVARTLAPHAERLTWLYPDAEKHGAFVPESLPDAAFRPLADWVDYVLDREHAPLEAWVQATQFDFAPFISREEYLESVRKPPARGPAPPKRPKPNEVKSTDKAPPEAAKTGDKPAKKLAGRGDAKFTTPKAGKTRRPTQAELRLRELERQYLALDAPLDSPERTPLWREMAQYNAALGHTGDATLCFSHVLWEDAAQVAEAHRAAGFIPAQGATGTRETPGAAGFIPAQGATGTRETSGAAGFIPAQAATGTRETQASLRDVAADWLAAERRQNEPVPITHEELERLAVDAPAPGSGVLAASLVFSAATQSGMPQNELALAADALARHESVLPVRAAWLAWLAVVELSGGDVLALARARDRLLMHLHAEGLRADIDLPVFLRSRGAGTQRFRAVRENVLELRRLAHKWIDGASGCTAQYVDLVFAYAMARLGETSACEKLMANVHAAFEGELSARYDQVHRWLEAAYAARIREALTGHREAGQLPTELLARREQLDRFTRYKVDRLREASRILEPHERIDPYSRWHGRYDDEVRRRLAELFELRDPAEIQSRLRPLLDNASAAQQPGEAESRVFAAALELAPRLGESLAVEALARAAPLLDRLSELADQARVLEKGLLAAAHFDLTEHGRELAARLDAAFHAHQEHADLSIRTLLGPSLRGLRRLGLRDELQRLLSRIADSVRAEPGASLSAASSPSTVSSGSAAGGRTPRPADKKKAEDLMAQDRRVGRLQVLLHVAAAWFYFGHENLARDVLDQARAALLDGRLEKSRSTRLACAYIDPLGEAPIEEAITRLAELFRKLPSPSDTLTTSSHYSRLQLDVIEATVLALVGGDLKADAKSRRWVDEDELLIRRRIHHDTRAALARAGLS